MSTWLPVIATLAGATVGGAITVFVTWLSSRGQIRLAALRFAEERATWAANRRLDQLREFHRAVETLGIAAQDFRIRTAWNERERKGEAIPSWVDELGDARGTFENAFRAVQLDVSLIDDDLLAEFSKINDVFWNEVMLGDDPVQGMVNIEKAVEGYRKSIAERYRAATKARVTGSDLDSGKNVRA